MIVIVDYGMGNLASIHNMLRKVGADATIASDPQVIARATKLILPGVGAFDNGMSNLERLGLVSVLHNRVFRDRVRILGICLGMQLLTHRSEEGHLPGLGWIDAATVRFRFDDPTQRLPVPHMGWNSVRVQKDDPLYAGLPEEPRFYFVHSYHVSCSDTRDVACIANYGGDFTAAISRDNIAGVQFHPEKSHKFGMSLLKNFASLPC